jgi:hypothetical protein
MLRKVDFNFRRMTLPKLLDFAAGAGTAALVLGLLSLLFWETARRGVSSTVFRYVGF